MRQGSPRISRPLLEVVAASGMFGFGLVIALLGAVLPLLAERLRFELAAAGNIFLAMNSAMLVVTLATGPLLDRYGTRPALLIAPVVSGAAVVAVARASTYAELVIAGALLGLGGGVLNTCTNMLVADLYDDPAQKNAAINRLGVWFGVGAVFLPFSIGALLEGAGLDNILYAAALLNAAPVILAALLRFPVPKHAGGGAQFGAILRLARDPLVIAFSLLLFFESGNEFVLSGFLTTFLVRDIGSDAQSASYILAMYWIAVMTSRILLGRSRRALDGTRVVFVCGLAVAACVLLIAASQSEIWAALAIFALGLSISPIYTTILGLAGSRFAENSGTVFSIMIAVALTGGMTHPWVVAHLGQSSGLRLALLVPAASAVAIALTVLWIGKRLRGRVA